MSKEKNLRSSPEQDKKRSLQVITRAKNNVDKLPSKSDLREPKAMRNVRHVSKR
jgi:hypothetical protein